MVAVFIYSSEFQAAILSSRYSTNN